MLKSISLVCMDIEYASYYVGGNNIVLNNFKSNCQSIVT